MADCIHEDARPSLTRKARLRFDPVRNTDLLLLPERVVKLNASAAAILSLCDGKRTVAEIAGKLSSQYGDADVNEDVLSFLNDFAERGWISL